MATLLEISNELLTLEARLEELGGDVEEAGGLVDHWLAACERQREKLDNYAALVRDLELRAEARKTESRRLAERARQDAERAAFLKERLKHHFVRHGIQSMDTTRFRITHARNGGLLPLLLDVDPETLPEPYRLTDVRYKADAEAIRAALEAGEPLTFARFGERSTSIRIS
ncbi:MAG TPA: siphovirus Gp157 family protein [Rhodothermales bacterium]|nr:siphovirus Gp157 family protein [Rhodothermales bacterium]